MGDKKHYVLFRAVPTMRCNFRCSYCFVSNNAKSTKATMFDQHPAEEWVQAMKQFDQYEVEFYFWGGEPFLPDGTYDVVKGWTDYNHVISGSRIDTNMAFATKIAERCPTDKLKLNCSWHPQYHSLDQMYQKVKMLNDLGMVGMVNFVASHQNLNMLQRKYGMTVDDLIKKYDHIGVFLNVAADFAIVNGKDPQQYADYKRTILRYQSPEDWKQLRGEKSPCLCEANRHYFTVQSNGDIVTCAEGQVCGNFFNGTLSFPDCTICTKNCPSVVSYCFRTDNSFPFKRHLVEYVKRNREYRESIGHRVDAITAPHTNLHGPKPTVEGKRPTVSVVLPTYNHLQFLPKAIDSVLGQTHSDLELIVVNDGSTDGTREYLDSLKDPRIRVIHQENKRLPAALNTGFRAARGELLTWISADNYCAPVFLETFVAALEAHPGAGLAYSAYARIDEHGVIIDIRQDQDLSYHKMLTSNSGVASFMYRRICQEKVGLYDPALECAEDWDYWLRILEHFETVYIPEVLYYYRRHANGMTKRMPRKVVQASRQVFAKTLERRNHNLDLSELYPTIQLCQDQRLAEFHACFDLGTSLLRSPFADVTMAVQFLEKAHRMAPDSVHVTSNLAVAHARLGQWEQTLPLLRLMMTDVRDEDVLTICQAVVKARQTNNLESLSDIQLFAPDKKHVELFQLERRSKRVFYPTYSTTSTAIASCQPETQQKAGTRAAESNKERYDSHFEEYVDKSREGIEDMNVSQHQTTVGTVSPTPNRKLKIAVLSAREGLSFMGQILARIRSRHEVWIVDCNDKNAISQALMSADVCWIEWATDLAVQVSKLPRRCRTVLRLHSFEAFRSFPLQIQWENVDDLVFVSPQIREVLKNQVPDIEAKVRTHVVPNCVDLDKFYFKDRPRGKRIAFVGALRPAKNIPFLIQCFREIHSTDPEYTLHVAGQLFGHELHQNELHHYIKHTVKEFEINGHIFFYGRIQDISRWLDDKDFILLTSIREGHPVSVIEGMAKGLKPVVHNFPGAKHFYPPKWIFNTAQECRDIILSPDFDRQEYVTYVKEHWSAERVLPQIDALLGSMGANRLEVREPITVQAERRLSHIDTPMPVSNPKVSVVTACYNAEEFLSECLDSILKQTIPEWELFLLDDGSTDGTRCIIEDYARRDARIKPYYFDDNKGPYVRRNFAIERANADFIVIHDADDIMCPDKLERLYEAITQDDRLGVVGSFYRMFLNEFRGIDHTDDVVLATTNDEILDGYTNHAICDFCPHGVAIIRKKLFEELGPYDENPFGSDSLWLAKVAEYAYRTNEIRLKNIPRFLTLRRMHSHSQRGRLPCFDPRNRRTRYRQYCECKLRKITEKLRAFPDTDLKTELRNCVCSDFLERFRDHIIRWENEPLSKNVIPELLKNSVWLFNKKFYVNCVSMLNGIEVMAPDIANRFKNYDLLRAMAFFAIDMKKHSRMFLNREMQNHRNAAAKQFISDYFEKHLKRDVQKWCAENADLYDLQMIDTRAVAQTAQ